MEKQNSKILTYDKIVKLQPKDEKDNFIKKRILEIFKDFTKKDIQFFNKKIKEFQVLTLSPTLSFKDIYSVAYITLVEKTVSKYE
jgi:hypothetical protein